MNMRQIRSLHQTLAPFVILPLALTILTGVSYRLAKSWFNLPRDQVHWLMVIHEGEYFGSVLEPVYVLLNGLGALWMLVTGGIMLWQNISRTWRQAQSKAQSKASKASKVDPESDLESAGEQGGSNP